MIKIENDKTYIGVVEDNNDPKKLGRVKIRVMNVFDDTKIEDIPFATPWKDLGGNEFNIPDIGKVVTVVFDNCNINSPEYISSDHYNINLETKLSELSNNDYLSMKSILFDHKTQIYVNESEGLKLDHKFNLINIKDNSININLKDNFGKINIGTENSTQRSILGDNFLNWFDDFVKILMGDSGGPFLGNLQAPVVATPALLNSLQSYQDMKESKFLSKNVYLVDNENISKLDRISNGQKGDVWKSTIKENTLTSKENINYNPIDGSTNTTFDKPNINSSTQSFTPNAYKPEENPDINIIKEIFSMKKYKIYDDINKLNILSIRNQCLSSGDKYTDQFVDKLYIIYKNENNIWQIKQWVFSTVPGLEFTITDKWLIDKNLSNLNPWIGSSGKKIYMKEYAKTVGNINGDPHLKKGLPILVPSQYVDTFYIDIYMGSKSMKVIPGASQLIWRDSDFDNPELFNPNNLSNPEIITPNDIMDNGIKIHMGYPNGIKVGMWSEGSHVFSSSDNLNDFFNYCEKHKELYGNKFTYTLATKKDWDEASKNILIKNESISDNIIENITPISKNTTSKNNSDIIDAFNNGDLLIETIIQDLILNDTITVDDIDNLSSESIKFKIKYQSIPNDWIFISSEISYITPISITQNKTMTVLTDEYCSFDIKNIIDNNNILGNYEINFNIYMYRNSNYNQYNFNKNIKFTIKNGFGLNPNANEYNICMLNPTTESGKKISGKITISQIGEEKISNAILNGLPNNGIIKLSSQPIKSDNISISDNMLLNLENEIIKQYNLHIKLIKYIK